MSVGWELTRGLFGASQAASRGIANRAAQSSAIRGAHRGRSAVRRGLIGPWDQIPAGAFDYLDYSGLATPGDLRPVTWSFPLGQYVLPKGRSWRAQSELGISAATANKHSIVYAPAGSGKTGSVLVPWIYHAMSSGYFVVAIDVKGNNDLMDQVQYYAASHGALPNVLVSSFDYTNPGQSVSWNWIRDLEDESAISKAAEALVPEQEGGTNAEFRARDLQWMRGLLEFAVETRQPWTVDLLVNLIGEPERFGPLLRNLGSQRTKMRFRSLIDTDALGSLDYDEYFKKVSFLLTYLDPLNSRGFNAVTRRAGVSLRNLADEPGLLVVTAPLADGKLSASVSGLFMGQFLNLQLKKFNQDNRPVLVVLDEAAQLQDRMDIGQILATARSSKTSVLLAIQEVEQLEEKKRHAILSNCATHILLGGAGEPTTKYFGERLGRRVASRATLSRNYGSGSHGVQTGFESHEVPVLGRNEMAFPPGEGFSALVHSTDLSNKPILVDLTRTDLMGG
jgi:hypothetical protein